MQRPYTIHMTQAKLKSVMLRGYLKRVASFPFEKLCTRTKSFSINQGPPPKRKWYI